MTTDSSSIFEINFFGLEFWAYKGMKLGHIGAYVEDPKADARRDDERLHEAATPSRMPGVQY